MHLHEKEIIHRDLKPANILMNDDGSVFKIADFGISVSVIEQVGLCKRSVAGTPWYMAPEVINRKPYGYGVDIWSLGCCLFELVTGERPWGKYHTAEEVMNAVVTYSNPVDLCSEEKKNFLYRKENQELMSFLTKCWKVTCNSRPSAEDLLKHPFLKTQFEPELSQEALLENLVLPEIEEEEEKVGSSKNFMSEVESSGRSSGRNSKRDSECSRESSQPQPNSLKSIKSVKLKELGYMSCFRGPIMFMAPHSCAMKAERQKESLTGAICLKFANEIERYVPKTQGSFCIWDREKD